MECRTGTLGNAYFHSVQRISLTVGEPLLQNFLIALLLEQVATAGINTGGEKHIVGVCAPQTY